MDSKKLSDEEIQKVFDETHKRMLEEELEHHDISQEYVKGLRKKGFEITNICDGVEVTIRRISDGEEYIEFSGECVEEAVDNAIPFSEERPKNVAVSEK